METYPSESAAHAAADALRLTINNRCNHRSLQRITINTVWEHYRREELPVKALSTQDSYIMYAKELDCPTLGQSSIATGQDSRGRALATGDRRRGRDQSQNQVRQVGFVLARGSLGILQPQPYLVGHTGLGAVANGARAQVCGSVPSARSLR